MYLTYQCPQCDQINQSPPISELKSLGCSRCAWERPFPAESLKQADIPKKCLRCGNADLWRQKNFPQSLGLLCVAAGAISSGIAWAYYRPILALSILMGFALLDMVFYLVLPDVLVCYRCRTKHHDVDVSQHGAFDHELGEKYRQEEIRRNEIERGNDEGADHVVS